MVVIDVILKFFPDSIVGCGVGMEFPNTKTVIKKSNSKREESLSTVW
jgi:hypothetical protein